MTNKIKKKKSPTDTTDGHRSFLRTIGLIHPRNLNGIKRIYLSTRIDTDKHGSFLRTIGLIHPRNLNGIKRIYLSTRILFFEHEFHESHEYLHPEHWVNSSAW